MWPPLVSRVGELSSGGDDETLVEDFEPTVDDLAIEEDMLADDGLTDLISSSKSRVVVYSCKHNAPTLSTRCRGRFCCCDLKLCRREVL